ncbi:MAG: SDR family oxidoreductase [Bdellovibrionales bacterium]|nr:SDR family oxidoreductase [Bdellovibrionales bacterium]
MGSLQFDFSERHVLITGGAQGIGQKIAERFLQSGASVTLWDIQECEIKGKSHIKTQKVDVSSYKECERGVKALEAPIDFLVNNAGILRDRSLAKLTETDYRSVIETNLNSVFYVTKSLLPCFNSHSFKRIVNLSSVVALYGNFGQTNYVAAKAGVIGLTKVWARELGRKGWTVNAIAPGFIHTQILQNMPEEILNSLIKKVPIGRLGQTEDVASACLFLCSEEASYINGITLSVDGGVTV